MQLQDTSPRCLAVDPNRPRKLYCGTFGQGLWLSNDAGRSWQSLDVDWPQAYRSQRVQALAVVEIES